MLKIMEDHHLPITRGEFRAILDEALRDLRTGYAAPEEDAAEAAVMALEWAQQKILKSSEEAGNVD